MNACRTRIQETRSEMKMLKFRTFQRKQKTRSITDTGSSRYVQAAQRGEGASQQSRSGQAEPQAREGPRTVPATSPARTDGDGRGHGSPGTDGPATARPLPGRTQRGSVALRAGAARSLARTPRPGGAGTSPAPAGENRGAAEAAGRPPVPRPGFPREGVRGGSRPAPAAEPGEPRQHRR